MDTQTALIGVLAMVLTCGCSAPEKKEPLAAKTRPAATAPAAASSTDATPQASYQGKTVGQWLELVVKPRDADDRARVVDALNAIGRAGVADLIVALKNPKYEIREEAAFALSRLRKDALPALPALVAQYDDENFLVWEAIGTAVESVAVASGKEALPTLLAGLQSPSVKKRQGVLAALREMGSAAAGAKDTVVKVRDADPDSDTRELAKETLDAIGAL